MPDTQTSKELYQQSCQLIPGGVNSPVRAFHGVGGEPIFFSHGKGAYLFDVDENAYIDYVCSWGAIILGHAHPTVITAIKDSLENGLGFGAPTEIEYQFAQKIHEMIPSIEMIRTVNSGTEATMSAIRVARGFTKRDQIVKFSGCYHGHSDSLLVAAGSGVLTLGTPSSAGVPENAICNTTVLPYNDSQTVLDYFKQHGEKTAAVIVEPIAGNMNLVVGNRTFLQTLRDCCSKYGALLIFDEVMSGFRVGRQSAQGLLQITPDLTCLGKIVGGGLGVATFGGRKEIMSHLAPSGTVYQAGTLSGNPIALTAGLTTLDIIQNDPSFFDVLSSTGERLCANLTQIAQSKQVPFCAQSIGGMCGFYFSETIPESFTEVQACNLTLFQAFFHAMLKEGVYLPPSQYEAAFISQAHNEDVINQTNQAAEKAFSELSAVI